MFLFTLLALALVSAAIFLAPQRAKTGLTCGIIAAGCLAAAVKAIGVLFDPRANTRLWQSDGLLFGPESGSMDTLSALFVLLIAFGGIAAGLYACGYLKHYLDRKSSAHVSLHCISLAVLVFSMMGVVCADGGYTFLFFWELMTIASFLLILFDAERKEVVRAALSYLVMMHIGFLFLVAGFVTLWQQTGSADFQSLALYYGDRAPLPLFILFLLGFGMKAGLFPMHVWLPEAHPAAPSHVSAVMSGVMIKTGVYGILRTAAPLSGEALYSAGLILLCAGIVTGLWGVILAAAQNDVKRLLAYSSIENIGIILIGTGFALAGKSTGNDAVALCGLCGALLHTLNHSLFKSLLFFGAGNILSETHTTSVDRLGGLAKHMPLTALLFLFAAAAISALPPLNGFVSEWLIYTGMFDNVADGEQVVISAFGILGLALIGGIVVLAFTKLYGMVFLGSPRSHAVAEAAEADNLRIAAMALPLAGILAVGLFPQGAVALVSRAAAPLMNLSERATAALAAELFPESLRMISLTAWLLVGVIALVYLLKRRLLKNRTVTVGPTWGCGFTAPNIRMQYTGESYSEGLQSIADTLTKETGEGDVVTHQEIFPSAHAFNIGHKDRIDTLFAAWWVELLHRINIHVMRFRTGKINHYVLFALAFLVLVFLLSLLNLI